MSVEGNSIEQIQGHPHSPWKCSYAVGWHAPIAKQGEHEVAALDVASGTDAAVINRFPNQAHHRILAGRNHRMLALLRDANMSIGSQLSQDIENVVTSLAGMERK